MKGNVASAGCQFAVTQEQRKKKGEMTQIVLRNISSHMASNGTKDARAAPQHPLISENPVDGSGT